MTFRSTLPLALALAAACGDGYDPDCGLPVAPATADTAISFLMDGRRVVMDSSAWSPKFSWYPDLGFAVIGSGESTDAGWESLYFRLTGFHGAGAYPVYAGYQDVPFASITYYCSSVRGQGWVGNEVVPDTVYVTTYDSVSTYIAGTFRARLTGGTYQDVLDVTDGHFQGYLQEYHPE